MQSRSCRVAVVVAAALILLVAAPRQTVAHQSDIKDVGLHVSGEVVDIVIRAVPADVAEAMGLAVDAQPTAAEAIAAGAPVQSEMASWMHVIVDGKTCLPGLIAVKRAKDPRFLEAGFRVQCSRAIEVITLDFARFFARSKTHSAVVHLTADDAPSFDAIVGLADSPLVVPLRGERPSTAGGWIRSGLDHIFGGPDHVAFVISLLLVVSLVRTPSGWKRRPLLPTLRATGLLVTSFTVAHSLTLIAASLGFVSAPGRFVEAMIAASILYTAVENVVKPDVRWRFLLTFGFGLVHGLGFASVLGELLPQHDVIVPLLLFNVGVELGQLAIVAIVLPLTVLAITVAGAPRYRRLVMPVVSLGIAVVGLIWLIERVANITILGF